MARPQKQGLEYFSLDVDMDQDDKVILIEAKHHITGFAVLVKLLMKIYKEGYFYKWSEREQLLFSSKINVDINTVNDVVNDSIKWEFFNAELYKKYGILTSSGIQKRYFEVAKRRKELTLVEEYLLVDIPESSEQQTITLINVDINQVNVSKNEQGEELKTPIIPKVKETKLKNTPSSKNDIFDKFWSVYPRKDGKQKALEKWYARLNDKQNVVNEETLIMSAKNYADSVKGTEMKYVKLASTFLGPGLHYKDFLQAKEGKQKKSFNWNEMTEEEREKWIS